jgi:hypothetical protein
MVGKVIMVVVALNIASSFHLIRRDKETITKRDYVKLLLESIFITLMILLAYGLYLSFQKIFGM